jgi:hypothetical protein
VLHQTVIVGVAYLVVGWDLPVWQQFAAVCVAGLALTVLLYEVLIRRFNPTRFLFGMKPLRPTRTTLLGTDAVPRQATLMAAATPARFRPRVSR